MNAHSNLKERCYTRIQIVKQLDKENSPLEIQATYTSAHKSLCS